ANGLGNLLNRSISMLKRYRNGVVPKRSEELSAEIADYVREVRHSLSQNELQGGLQGIWKIVNRANQYVDQTAPFKLAKDPAQAARLDEVLYNLVECCRLIAICLWPYVPQTAEKIFGQLGLKEEPNRFIGARWGGLVEGHTVGDPVGLFPRKDQPKTK
ncbi:MAG TPA: methionine--tRNA ligase, partial [Verrucomicrobiae bacterium]|nr:methionine--tRNA ligase [Verrucomicrobiae bacterium]